MKKQLHFKKLLFLLAFFFLILENVDAQNVVTPEPIAVPFDVVPNSTFTIHGELKMIANSIVGPNDIFTNESGVNQQYVPNDDYNGFGTNNRKTFGYIDIDQDPDTFSSSSADFVSENAGCAKIAYAGLYWSAAYYIDRTNNSGTESNGTFARYENLPPVDNRPDFRTIKFKTPGAANYIDIPAASTTVLYNGYRNTVTNPNDIAVTDMPYACYTDVTDIVRGLANPNGTYTVANMRSSTGRAADNSSGISGGWVLAIVYEDASLPKKYISTNSGFLDVSNTNSAEANKTFTYTGFQTAPAPLPVKARYAIATLEGDLNLAGDRLMITKPDGSEVPLGTAPANPQNNFFDSSITVDGAYVDRPLRTPASRNTLGFDADIFDIPNPSFDPLIGNDQTSVDFRITTNSDRYRVFFNAFQVEVIEPKLSVVKRVLDVNLVDITGGYVYLADQFFYELTIQNQGNEDLINTSIKTRLPSQVDFSGLDLVQADPGINYTYDELSREINITIDDNFVERFDAPLSFRYGVDVVSDCSIIAETCTGEIESIAVSSYTGLISGISSGGEPSIIEQDFCNFDVQGPASILIDLTLCEEQLDVFLCGGSVDLRAGAGFSRYEWTNLANPNLIISTNQVLTVTQEGSYRVLKSGTSGCQDISETYFVTSLNGIANPIVDIVNTLNTNPNPSGTSGNIKICPITGKDLPEIFLCGSASAIDLDTGFIDASDIIWERLDPAACTNVPRTDECPTVDPICDISWTTEGTGQTFTVSQAGEYRITAVFDNSCPVSFYFNVFKNDFEPVLTVVKDITCNSAGIMIVQNSSDQYEYQLIDPNESQTPYQDFPEFDGLTIEGTYILNARQKNGLPTACVFQSQKVLRALEPNVLIDTENPICPDNLGAINIAVTGGEINYIYNITSIEPGNAFSDSEGPTTDPNHVFTGLNPGTYDVEVLSFDGDCSYSETVVIDDATNALASTTLIKDLSCNPDYQPDTNLPGYDPDKDIALIIFDITAGSGDYAFSNTPDFSTFLTPESVQPYTFRVTTSGNYDFYVMDLATSCSLSAGSVFVSPYEAIQFSALPSELSCSDDSGVVEVTVSQGQAPFVYTLDDTTIVGPTNDITMVFGNVDPSIAHTIKVSDSFGCEFESAPIVFTVPTSISIETIVSRELNCTPNSSDAIIHIQNITGGSGNYEWSFDAASAFTAVTSVPFDIVVGSAGTYTVFIRNQGTGDCVVSNNIVVDPLSEFVITNSTPKDVTCFGKNDGVIEFTVNSTNFSYEIVDVNAGFNISNPLSTVNTVTVDKLPVGTYNLRVVDNSTNCDDVETFIIQEPFVLEAEAIVTQLTTENDGRIIVDPRGGTDPYTYSIDGDNTFAASNTFENLVAGEYFISVKDSNGCIVVVSATIDAITTPIFVELNLDNTYVTCYGANTASITSFVTGGLGEYTYSLIGSDYLGATIIMGPQADAFFANLNAGSYEYIVNDSISTTFTITQPEEFFITTQPVGVLCNGDTNGSIKVNSFGGNASYVYSLYDNGQNPIFSFIEDGVDGLLGEHTFDGLAGGTYVIEVEDVNGCRVSADNIIIDEPFPISLDVNVIPVVNGTDGAIEVIVTGGTPPYVFSLNDSAYTTDNTFTNLSAGTYTVLVRDVTECPVQYLVTIDPVIDPIAVTLDIENTTILCYADNTASISSTVTGGSGTYFYTLVGTDYFGIDVNVGPQNDAFFGSLSAGNYEYIVNDSESISFTIVQSEPLQATIIEVFQESCNGDNDGAVIIEIEGGTPPYETNITNNDVDFVVDMLTYADLPSGTTTVFVRDANNCRAELSVEITEATPISFDLTVTPITNDADGIIEINASSANSTTFTYSLKDAQTNTVIATQTTNIFTVGTPGSYIVSALSENGCFTEQLVVVESTEENPLLEYADEIIFCAITGQVYPTIEIQDANGETLDLPFEGVVSIVWQQFDDITCDIELEDDCPTTESSCTSDWFNISTGLDCEITNPGQYRVVIEFAAKSVDQIQTYYFKAVNNKPDVKPTFALFPNPARGIVELNTDVKSVEVFDAMGKMVLQTTQDEFDISFLFNGVYFVRITTDENEEINTKLIKK